MSRDIALTASDVAPALRELADLLEEHGLPDRRVADQALGLLLIVNSVDAVTTFAAQHGLTPREHGGHTSAELMLGLNPNAEPHSDAHYTGAVVLSVTHMAKPEPEQPAMSQHRAEYECTEHRVIIICAADATDDDYEQYLADVDEHNELHLAQPVPYELTDTPAPAALPELPQRVRGSHGAFQPDDRVQTPEGPGTVQWAKPVGTFTVVAVEHDDRPGHVVGYLAHQVTIDLAGEGARALAAIEAREATR